MKLKEYEVIYKGHWRNESIGVRCYNKEEAREMFNEHYPEYKNCILSIKKSN